MVHTVISPCNGIVPPPTTQIPGCRWSQVSLELQESLGLKVGMAMGQIRVNSLRKLKITVWST